MGEDSDGAGAEDDGELNDAAVIKDHSEELPEKVGLQLRGSGSGEALLETEEVGGLVRETDFEGKKVPEVVDFYRE